MQVPLRTSILLASRLSIGRWTAGLSSGCWPACLAGTLGIWLGFPNDVVAIPPLILLWPLAVIYSGFHVSGYWQALREGWLVSLPGCIAALYWLALPVAEVGELAWPLAILCAIGIAAILACQGAIYAVLAHFCRNGNILARSVALGLGWYLLEYVFAILVGFPWLAISGALSQWPLLIQCADVVGAWLLGGIWIGALFSILWGKGPARIAGFVLCVALLGRGCFQLFENGEEGATFPCLMVQGNIDQNQKWVPEFQQATLDLYIGLTQNALSEFAQKPLIIWPETALPFFYQKVPWLAAQVRRATEKFDAPLLFGAPGVESAPDGAELIYNRAFLLDPRGRTIGEYDKEHLVPFGEYVPAWLKLDFLDALMQGVGVYSEGTKTKPLRYHNLAPGMLICYEGIFPWLAQARTAAGANVLIDISNDGWFGRTPASRQHLFLTVPRCVEQGRWLMRATNTGITAVIDNRGRIRMAGELMETSAYPCEGRTMEGFTIHTRIAPWLPLLAAVIFPISLAWIHTRRNGNNASFE